MQTLKTILLLLALTATTATAQTIRIADNNLNAPTGPNTYATVQAAHDAAAPGDIVYVQPSPTSYGDLTINKQITLRGVGFNTGRDFPHNSVLNDIVLTNRSDNATNASGTVIEGIAFRNIFLGVRTGSFSYTFENITINNCSCSYLWRDGNSSYMPINNLTVKNSTIGVISFAGGTTNQLLVYGNRFISGIGHGYVATTPGVPNPCNCGYGAAGTLSNAIISNNIFETGAYINNQNSSVSVIITNNVFLGLPANNHRAFNNLWDVTVTNNIFYGSAPNSIYTFERNSFTNNLSFGTVNNALPPVGSGVGNTGSNNIVNQDPLFVNVPYNTAYASTMNFNLQSSSPARNAGSDGTDIGITGGTYPLTSGNILLKATNTPVIMQFNPGALVPQNQPVKANIKAKSN